MGNGRIVNLLRGKSVTFDYNYLEGTNLFSELYRETAYANYYSDILYISYFDDDEGRRYKFSGITANNGNGSDYMYGPYFYTIDNNLLPSTLLMGNTYTISFFAKANKTVNVRLGSEWGKLYTDMTLDTNWQRVVITRTIDTSTPWYQFILYARYSSTTSFNIEIKDIQIKDVNGTKKEFKLYNLSKSITETPTRTGFAFQGWYDKPIGGNKVTKFNNLDTVYAHWKQNVWDRFTLYNSSYNSIGNYQQTFTKYLQSSASGSLSITRISGSGLPEIKSTCLQDGDANSYMTNGLVTKGTVNLTNRKNIVAEISSGSIYSLQVFSENSLRLTSSAFIQLDGVSEILSVQSGNETVKRLTLDISALSGDYYIVLTNYVKNGSYFILDNLYVE